MDSTEAPLNLDHGAAAQALEAELAAAAAPLDAARAAQAARAERATLGRLLFGALALLLVALLGMRALRALLPAADDIAPNLTLTTFDGDTLRLSDLRGQGVVINFWASWCGPCVAEAPILAQGWRDAQGRNVTFLGVVMNSDTPALAQQFLAAHGLEYPNGFDADGAWETAYGIDGIPATYFIDANGRIAAQAQGMLPNQAYFNRRLNQIAAPAPNAAANAAANAAPTSAPGDAP